MYINLTSFLSISQLSSAQSCPLQSCLLQLISPWSSTRLLNSLKSGGTSSLLTSTITTRSTTRTTHSSSSTMARRRNILHGRPRTRVSQERPGMQSPAWARTPKSPESRGVRLPSSLTQVKSATHVGPLVLRSHPHSLRHYHLLLHYRRNNQGGLYALLALAAQRARRCRGHAPAHGCQ